jgi:pyruvate-ferredoxin/flavodoxin oxidoreductase
MDLALIAQASTLATRIPFVHAFDGFRTSHEVAKIEKVTDTQINGMIRADRVDAHRHRALTPDHPVLPGTAQNPDVYFQGRESVNSYYDAAIEIVQTEMDKFAHLAGHKYHLFDYAGAPDAERVIIVTGSGSETRQGVRACTAAKMAIDIPIIGSLNGTTSGCWVRYARNMEDAGADEDGT